jgi:hypothetical protein
LHYDIYSAVSFIFLFMVYLTTLAVANTVLSNGRRMNWKECGRKRSLPNLRYCPEMCLESLRNTPETLR